VRDVFFESRCLEEGVNSAVIFIGLDIGTTSICGVAYELPEGKTRRAITVPNRSAIAESGNAEEGQHPDQLLDTVEQILRTLTFHYPDIEGIGVTGQMHGVLYTDHEGHAVSPLYTWQDQKGRIPAGDGDTLVDRLVRECGYPLATGFGLVTHSALHQLGKVPTEAVRLCTIADFIAMRLTKGRNPIMDASNAASIGFFDVALGQFDMGALRQAGINPNILPPVVPSIAVVGETETGVPVFNAIGDNQASVLGSVADLRTSLLLNVGTGGQLSAYSERYFAVEGLETRPFPGGGYLLVGASLAGGKSYAMLEEFFRSVLKAFWAEGEADKTVHELYGKMEALLDRLVSADYGLTVRTQFFGTRLQPDRKGAIEGIGPANFTPEHLIYGFLAGLTEELYAFYLLLPEEIRRSSETLTGSGNGLRRNRHLRRLCEERFGLQLRFPDSCEEAAVGAALHAAVCAGAVDGYAVAGKRI
jgi:sedoheptulokinase